MSDVDPFLQRFASLVEGRGNKSRYSITISVGGIFITGLLVNSRQLVEYFIDALSDSTMRDPSMANETASERLQLRGVFRGTLNEHFSDFLADASTPHTDPTIIHIVSCRFFLPGSDTETSLPGTFWRGRISAVDGFMLGEISLPMDTPPSA
jgi:hypothetical protein